MFSQEEYSPEDPANPCADYPTEEYESYADCDDHFVRKSLPEGLKPFWTVDNISEATNTYSMKTELYDEILAGNSLSKRRIRHAIKLREYSVSGSLYTGLRVSDCRLPCLQTETSVEEGLASSQEIYSAFILTFNDEVRVKKISVDKFNFLVSLNLFGSYLGLWPGLGLYQIIDWMVGSYIARQIFEKLRYWLICINQTCKIPGKWNINEIKEASWVWQ